MSNRKFEVDFLCDECRQSHIVVCETAFANKLSEGAITQALEVFHPFCCEACGGDSFHVTDWLEDETAPLLARIAELEAAVQMNLDASTDIAEDESIDAMRGRLQSIRAKSTHALKKAGGND